MVASIGIQGLTDTRSPIPIFHWKTGDSNPGVNYTMQPFKIPFNNEYVNQQFGNVTPFNTGTHEYTILQEGIYNVNVSLNLFMLSSRPAIDPNLPPIVLNNVGRYRVYIFKNDTNNVSTLIASEESIFKRNTQIPAERRPSGVEAINDNDIVDMSFSISTNPSNVHKVNVGDSLYVSVQLMQGPVGSEPNPITEYTFSILVAPFQNPAPVPQISGTFFNVQRISATH